MFLYWLLLLCARGVHVVNSKSLEAPSNLGLTATDTGLIISWEKPEDDEIHPITGYKVKFCEFPKKTIHKFEKTGDSEVLVEETRPVEPFEILNNFKDEHSKSCKELSVGAAANNATFEGTQPEVLYVARVQTVTDAGPGPLSDPVSVQLYPDSSMGSSVNDLTIQTN